MAAIRIKEEIEINRHNVTPSQFLTYVRQQIKKHGLTAVTADEIDLDYFRAGNDIEFDYHDIPGKPCKAEKSVSKPYEMQTYILNWDGTVYNFIMEFSFDNDKTGYGYFYFINTWDRENPQEEIENLTASEEEETETNTENIVETLRKANESVKGTNNWNKYTMPQETKIDKKWVFVGWGTPVKQLPVKIKRVKGKIYLVQESELETDRYTVTDEVKQLLNL